MMQNILSQSELDYYQRHLALEAIGQLGQEKLKKSRVLCVGAGGLGCPLLLYLAGAGIGTIGVVDPDVVNLSNLHRQVLYSMEDIGASKAERACLKIRQLNPHIQAVSYPVQLVAENAVEIIAAYDIIADCTDNFASRYLINDICFSLNKPNVQASIHQFEGYCSVFTAANGPCYRCLFDVPPDNHAFHNCAEAGVLGVLPGVLGGLQAVEIIKLVVSMGQPLVGRVLKFNALTMAFQEFSLERKANCLLCSQQRSETLQRFGQTADGSVEALGLTSCGLSAGSIENQTSFKNKISPEEFIRLKEEQSLFLLDVREPHEYAIDHLDGYLIPLQQLPHRLSELDVENTIVVHCRTNPRSLMAYDILEQAGFKSVFYLDGGIEGYRRYFARPLSS
jgi:adenylyltransferase/sulfurtransferase